MKIILKMASRIIMLETDKQSTVFLKKDGSLVYYKSPRKKASGQKAIFLYEIMKKSIKKGKSGFFIRWDNTKFKLEFMPERSTMWEIAADYHTYFCRTVIASSDIDVKGSLMSKKDIITHIKRHNDWLKLHKTRTIFDIRNSDQFHNF